MRGILVLDVAEVHGLDTVVATIFPILAIAYFTGSRQMFASVRGRHGIDWRVPIDLAPAYRRGPLRLLVHLISAGRLVEDQVIMDERVLIRADAGFALTFLAGLLASVAGLIVTSTWVSGIAVVLLVVNTCQLVSIATQASMIEYADQVDGSNPCLSRYQPFRTLRAVLVMNTLAVSAAVLIGIVLAFFTDGPG